jgi:hypothetical protein
MSKTINNTVELVSEPSSGDAKANTASYDRLLPFNSNRCKCAECSLYFSSPTAFDAHIKRRQHLDPSEVGLVMRGEYWSWPEMDKSRVDALNN